MTVLGEIHDELDSAVAAAYGWPAGLPDEEILSRLVALNAERAEEEKQGTIRWLRPEYQTKSKEERKMIQGTLDMPPVRAGVPARGKSGPAEPKTGWPSELVEQVDAVRNAVQTLLAADTPVTAETVAARFARAPRARIRELLQILVDLGHVNARAADEQNPTKSGLTDTPA